ncbi:MAG: hypothetical protein B7Z08_11820 [Sphingomonadales bacterium 32-68-7]|nr:MAG: hypothetical protein B7Z33_07420 [Sphingomonadales bacterium 12-68-11]OYX07753.1 MAG: hypothetical protein B7Z08_11820 [Sphingomonadales bacterium 32-68-7]
MTEDTPTQDQLPLPLGAGDLLRQARTAQGLSLAQVAAETRIPLRHLDMIEAGNFAALPARTYAVGFARTYAKQVGLDPAAIVAKVREELSEQTADMRVRPATFEPGDPARVPSSALGWLSLAAIVLVLAGMFVAYRTYFIPAAELPSLVAESAPPPSARASAVPPGAASAAAASGPVVFTALEPGVWVKFYDAAGNQLMQKQMALGERYTVPADAEGPLLWTGRPDALAITVAGQAVPKLGEQEVIVRDVPVTAAALLARPASAPTPAPSQAPAEAPAPRPSPTG